MTEAASAAVTRALATWPNQLLDPSRASILAHIAGMKFGLGSGSGQASRYARNISLRYVSRSLELSCSINLLVFIIQLFQLDSSSLALKDEGPVTSFMFFNTR